MDTDVGRKGGGHVLRGGGSQGESMAGKGNLCNILNNNKFKLKKTKLKVQVR